MAATDPTFDEVPEVGIQPEVEPERAPEQERAPEPEPSPEPQVEPEATADAPHVTGGCPVTWCPICVTVGAVQPLRPDVMEHLLKAGTELFMAFRAVIDARADETSGEGGQDGPPASTTLEKIDLG